MPKSEPLYKSTTCKSEPKAWEKVRRRGSSIGQAWEEGLAAWVRCGSGMGRRLGNMGQALQHGSGVGKKGLAVWVIVGEKRRKEREDRHTHERKR